LALLFAQAGARADLVAWSYNWTPSATVLFADSPGTSKIMLTNEPVGAAEGSSDIVATNIKTASTATAAAPDTFTNAAYKLTLSLVDTQSKMSAALTFDGFFSGTLSATSSNLKNTFAGNMVQKVQLGSNMYTVTMTAFAPPGPPD